MPSTPQQRSPAQSSDNSSFNPRHIDENTLKCLTGEIEEPSAYIPNLSKRALSLVEWCDRMLSPGEQRVANPREKKYARNGHLDLMRPLWAERLAGERAAAQAEGLRHANNSNNGGSARVSSEVSRTPSVRRFFTALSRAVQSMIIAEGKSRNQGRDENEAAGLSSRGSVVTVVHASSSKPDSGSDSSSNESIPVSTLVQRFESFLLNTETVIARAEVIQADNEHERDVIIKFRHLLVDMDRQVMSRCYEEGFTSENTNSSIPNTEASSGSSNPTFVPGAVESEDKAKSIAADTEGRPSENDKAVPDNKDDNHDNHKHDNHNHKQESHMQANMTKSREAEPQKTEQKLNPKAEAYKPRCRPITADMLANPDRYHTCGCDKKTVVECEHCEGDKVFCDPYRW